VNNGKTEFSVIISPAFSVIYPLEIVLCGFDAQEKSLMIANVENSSAAQYFCGKPYIF